MALETSYVLIVLPPAPIQPHINFIPITPLSSFLSPMFQSPSPPIPLRSFFSFTTNGPILVQIKQCKDSRLRSHKSIREHVMLVVLNPGYLTQHSVSSPVHLHRHPIISFYGSQGCMVSEPIHHQYIHFSFIFPGPFVYCLLSTSILSKIISFKSVLSPVPITFYILSPQSNALSLSYLSHSNIIHNLSE